MMIAVCKSKIHRVRVTDANLNYEGSITIDQMLLKKADIIPYELVQVVNINNGARFETYVIPGKANSGTVCLNGPAARLGEVGDVLIVISYAWMEKKEAEKFKPKVVYVDKNNKPKKR
jgi:aspartate 1-decarboxylase